MRNSQARSHIPKYHQLILPILQICSQRDYTKQEIEDIVADRFNLTKQKRMIILRGKETLLTNRIYWATLYLKKANLLSKEDHLFHITNEGHEILKQNPSYIDKKFLLKIPVFAKWINKSDSKDKSDMDNAKLDELIAKSLELMKHNGIYLGDLVKRLNISDAVKDLLVHKLLKTQGVIKEKIQHQGGILEILLRYESPIGDVESENDSVEHDLSYLNKHQTKMIQKMVRCLPESEHNFEIKEFEDMILESRVSAGEIRTEFGMDVEKFIELAYATEPPNKISMIVEFERIKSDIGRVPTKQDIDEHSMLKSSQYDKEFESWEHMLERLGYDPWYRTNSDVKNKIDLKQKESILDTTITDSEDIDDKMLEKLRQNIKHGLRNEPNMLKLYDVLDQNIRKCNKTDLSYMINHLGNP